MTSDVLTPVPTATAYRVLDTMPFGLKRLRTYLRERDVGRLTIKKRGTAVVPEQLRRQLDLRGQRDGDDHPDARRGQPAGARGGAA